MDKYSSLKLENQLCFPLYALSREVMKLYTPLLEKYGLTYTQYVTMMAIWEKEQIIFKDLGKILHLDSGTLTPVLKKLEAMELIHKYRCKEDDRTVMVELSEKGRLLKDEIIEVPQQIICSFKGNKENLLKLKKYLDAVLADFDKDE